MKKQIVVGAVVAAAAAWSFVACNNTSGSGLGGPVNTTPANPGGTGGGGGAAPVGVNVMEIRGDGFQPQVLTAPVGANITFVNRDTVDHQIASNTEPQNADCPEFNGPVLAPGQNFTVQIAGVPRNCGIHDHLNATNTTFAATITIVSPINAPTDGGPIGGAGGGAGGGFGGGVGGGAGGGTGGGAGGGTGGGAGGGFGY